MKKIFVISCFVLSAKTLIAQQSNNKNLPPIKTSGAATQLPQHKDNQKPPIKTSDGVAKTTRADAFIPVKTTDSNTPDKPRVVKVKAPTASSSKKQ